MEPTNHGGEAAITYLKAGRVLEPGRYRQPSDPGSGDDEMTAERSLAGANLVFFGGTSGIGRAAATALSIRGASVLIVGRGADAGERAVNDIRAAGGAADFLAGDLSTVAGVAAVAEGVRGWRPRLDGVMHTAMSAFRGRQVTADGMEFAFALQYFARAALNRLLVDRLEASGDGRILHIAGNVPGTIKPDLDDLQFEHRRWSFYKSVLGTHILGFMHIQEAAKLWSDRPISIAAACVGPTRTASMADARMPLSMRLMGRFGARPEVSAANAIRFFATSTAEAASGSVYRHPGRNSLTPLSCDPNARARLWEITTLQARNRGLELP